MLRVRPTRVTLAGRGRRDRADSASGAARTRSAGEGDSRHGVGLQEHDRIEWPSVAQQDSTIAAFGELGMKVTITELDIDVLP